jgi:signal transduction histidine kinase
MPAGQWFCAPRHLPLLFLAIAVAPAVAVTWLSWRLLEQDRALEAQRIHERLESAADLAGAQLRQAQAEIEEALMGVASLPARKVAAALSQRAEQLGDAAVLVAFEPERVESYPGDRLLYYPYLPSAKEAPEGVFAAGEQLEFQKRDYQAAAAAYRRLAGSKDIAIRAGVLLRLARSLRKARRFEDALGTYRELEKLGSVRVEELPAELVARHSACGLLAELNRLDQLHREAESLDRDLHGGRWKIPRAAYHFYAQEAQKWLDRRRDQSQGVELAAGVQALWEEWARIRAGEGAPGGCRSLWFHERPVLVLWRSTPERLVALVAGRAEIQRFTNGAMQPVVQRQRVRPALTDGEGHLVTGVLPASDVQQVVRSAADTHLPWTLHLVSIDPAADLSDLASRRRLLLAGLAMMAAVLLVGIYFIGRALTREVQVARLKSDFVSAVSHEFRSPLTTMRQITEMLSKGRIPSEERRQQYYEVLTHETDRLHRLVEGLLNFGRIEAGMMEYRLEPLDPAELARAVVAGFQEEVTERGYRIELNVNGTGCMVRADREALGRALWNLLDNAVKYSPECQTVWVDVAQNGRELTIQVRDHGVGMGPDEQGQIFKKFVRGAAAQAAGVKGTGIGLATVDHIVRAHGGEVRVESEPGRGSAFSIVLPVME